MIYDFIFSERLLIVTEHYQQTLKKVAKSGKYSAYVTFIDTLYMHKAKLSLNICM